MIAAVVLHTMNIEGQIHQKNPGMGQTPPPLSGNARILEAPVIATPPLQCKGRHQKHRSPVI